MESKTTWEKFRLFMLMLAGLLGAISTIGAGTLWLFQEKIEDGIMEVVERHKGPSFRIDCSKKMDIDSEDVDNEIGWMYNMVIKLSSTDDSKGNKWIEYLEAESQWRAVGYFVSINDKGVIKYHHSNGRNYDAWTDLETGQLYYIKDGYRYY